MLTRCSQICPAQPRHALHFRLAQYRQQPLLEVLTFDIDKRPSNHPFALKGVQLSLVRPTKAFFGWIPSNRWIFHHSSAFLITLGPSSSAFVSFLSYHWLFNVATSFVNGPLQGRSMLRWSPYSFIKRLLARLPPLQLSASAYEDKQCLDFSDL